VTKISEVKHMTKLVWENDSLAVEAPKDLRSGWHRVPNEQRKREENSSALYHVGAFTTTGIELQRLADADRQVKQQKKLTDIIDWLDDL
jgi:hypothetical protein